jgi:hypothetical protein
MPSLNPISRREFIRKLKALGFEGPFPGGDINGFQLPSGVFTRNSR